jgi:hypothetical protein
MKNVRARLARIEAAIAKQPTCELRSQEQSPEREQAFAAVGAWNGIDPPPTEELALLGLEPYQDAIADLVTGKLGRRTVSALS